MERANPPPSWTLGAVSVVLLLALTWLGAAGAATWMATGEGPVAKTRAAGLQVVATDGAEARLFLERAGAPPRAMPLCCETAPGKVTARVARYTPEGDWRQDSIELDLQAGRLYVLPIGGRPVRIEAWQPAGPASELRSRYPVPGVVGRARDGTLESGDPRLEPVPLETTLVASEDYGNAEGWLPANERLLVAANPFLTEIRISVSAERAGTAPDWRQECTLRALDCRVFALGTAATVRVSCTRVEDGAALGESRYSPPAEPGHPLLYTVGGATAYAWLGSVSGRMPMVPAGEWAELPQGLEIRPRQPQDPKHWILVAKGPAGSETGLAPLASAPLSAFGPKATVQARADVTVRELALPPELRSKAVVAVAAEGDDLWGIVDGVVHDLRTGKALHAREPALVGQMAATPFGLVLITRAGRLATLANGRIVSGASLLDPTLRLAPATGDPPAVWLFGGTLAQWALVRQPLDGSPGTPQVRSGGPPATGAAEESAEPEIEAPEESEAELMGEDGETGMTDEESLPAEEIPAPEASPISPTAIAAASGGGTLLAGGRRIERMQEHADAPGTWAIEPVLTLPEEGPDVIGMVDLDGRLLFSTEECVYELRGNLVLPLVEGIGGSLVRWRSGLVVCDARSGRLYHLSGPAFAAPKGAPR